MAILQALADLGFPDADIVNETDSLQTVRIRTSRGWVYEKFQEVGQAQQWAKKHKPEVKA